MAGLYKWVKLHNDPNKNLDLVDLNMFYVTFYLLGCQLLAESKQSSLEDLCKHVYMGSRLK